ncbi:hypothetical protein [Chelatococcus sp. HY11]|uniref:hypothetical protein n=1 Tax=Chelatococcus sp. HY11 TaxID=2835634 RepID=UPI001BCE9E6B|nr:hypothetical protein [Chelatococcus sp. HY11]MBS7743689.1 hypothetical protein [Chelatococcus sp. HY11]CAH1665100.1 hypothetical protein CHELA20_40440 [Hyphomicrobiales bacterium]CAH1688724.1 hypothetical protein CHELA41_40298 [Hyphomicrobiales bacterium]
MVRHVAMPAEVTLASPDYMAQSGLPDSTDALLNRHRMTGFQSTAADGLLPPEFVADRDVRPLVLPTTIAVSAAAS